MAPAIIGVWFVLGIAASAAIDSVIRDAEEQRTYQTLAAAVLLVGLAVILRLVDRRRKAGGS